jgi:hypothetical protein
MRTCSICKNQYSDSIRLCQICGIDLDNLSETAVILKRLQENPRVRAIRIFAQPGACPVCREVCGVYPKDRVPKLPVMGCSDKEGCQNTYAPSLDDIYP